MIYLQLFWSFFQIGLLSIGGGYAAMPLIQEQVVHLHSWLTMAEFSDIITIAEMTPGPIAVNSATFVGIQVSGIPGAIIATFGCILPSCVIVMTLAHIYYKYREISMVQGVLQGLRPAVVAMIASAGISILLLSLFGDSKIPTAFGDINFISVFIFGLSIVVLRKWRINPIYVMAGAGVLGLILYQLTGYHIN
jgi:chromate transporter